MEPQPNVVEQFNEYRTQQNARIMGADSLILKRIFNLDTNTYQQGALDVRTKELLGLVASLVLRCDDCVKYHIQAALEAEATEREIIETFEIATLVGGTIVVPHLRRAFEFLDAAKKL